MATRAYGLRLEPDAIILRETNDHRMDGIKIIAFFFLFKRLTMFHEVQVQRIAVQCMGQL
jgi:hypothetical protein